MEAIIAKGFIVWCRENEVNKMKNRWPYKFGDE